MERVWSEAGTIPADGEPAGGARPRLADGSRLNPARAAGF